MNENIKRFKQQPATNGFIKGLIGDDFVYELIGQYIDFDKEMSMCIHDDTQNTEFDIVAELAEVIYEDGSEMFEICEDDSMTCLIYKSSNNIVCFVIKKQWSVAFWN